MAEVKKYKPDADTSILGWLNQWMQTSIKNNQTGVRGAAGMMSGNNPTEQVVPGATPPEPKPEKPAATAQPPRTGGGQNLPPSAAQPGTGPADNQVGSDADPNQPGLQGPGDPGARTNANGLRQYGQTLGGLNKFTSEFTGGYELTDIKSAFQSNDLEGAYTNGSNTISTEDSKYTLPDGATPSNVGGKYSMDGADTSLQNTGYQLDAASVPGTVGKDANDPQSGVSDKPDRAENIRQVRMDRQSGRGSRRDPRNRGADSDMFSAQEPSNQSLTSPMYANSKRNAIRSTFLDYEGSSVKAAAAANAVAGYGKDSNGNARFNYGGELVYAKPGQEYEARNAAMMGQNPSQFLDIPATPDVQPDTPAASELSPAFAEVKPEVDKFFQGKLKQVKDGNK